VGGILLGLIEGLTLMLTNAQDTTQPPPVVPDAPAMPSPQAEGGEWAFGGGESQQNQEEATFGFSTR